MLDMTRSVELPSLPGLAVFRDDREAATFYAWPRAPRIARDAGGEPQIGLLLYGRRGPTGVALSGGQFSATLDLALEAGERRGLEAGLVHLLQQEHAASGAEGPAPAPVLASPHWIRGEVTFEAAPGVRASGRPSLVGDNQAALALSLDADQATAFDRAWGEGLRDAALTYRLEVSAAHGRSATQVDATIREEAGGTYRSFRTQRTESERRTAAPTDVTLTGGADLRPNVLARKRSLVAL